MSSRVITIDANAPLWDAVAVMVRHAIKRIPVVVGDRLVGIVSRHDLLECLVPEATSEPSQ